MHLLHYACARGQTKLVKYIVENQHFGVDLDFRDGSGNTSSHLALRNRHFELVKYIARAKGDKNIIRLFSTPEEEAEAQYSASLAQLLQMRALEAEQAKQAESQPERVAQADARAQRAAARAARRAKLFE